MSEIGIINKVGSAIQKNYQKLDTIAKRIMDKSVYQPVPQKDTVSIKGASYSDMKTTLDAMKKEVDGVQTLMSDLEQAQFKEMVTQVKDALEDHMKIWPPYPEGSEEMVKFLRSLSGMRELIDKLTVPPPGNIASDIVEMKSIETQNKALVAIVHVVNDMFADLMEATDQRRNGNG